MSKYEDFVFIAPAKQKIVSTVGSQPYRTISLCPYCKLVKRPLGH